MKKIKLNKYSREIESEVDLHGLTEKEAEAELFFYLREVLAEKQGLVRVITGKGLHSKDGRAVVKEMAMDVLKGLGLHFRDGKPTEGGEGVLIIDLTK